MMVLQSINRSSTSSGRLSRHSSSTTMMGNNKNSGNSSSSSSNNNNEQCRPTEAQLRWAQLHKKARARAVKEQVAKLYETPALVSDVDGALSDDGASTSSEEETEELELGGIVSKRLSLASPSRRQKKAKQKEKQRKDRPKISRGRRAMLKVSQRTFEKRRQMLTENGYQCWNDKENNGQQEGATATTTTSATTNQDAARVNRFEAAYAMMMSLNKPESKPVIVRSSKRWTRPNMNASSTMDYQDWKWGIARRKRTATRHSMPMLDRRASWLVHVPARQQSSRLDLLTMDLNGRRILDPSVSMYEHPHHADNGELLSPGALKFEEMVSRLQQHDGIPEPHTVNVSARYLSQLPQEEPIESPRVVRRPKGQMMFQDDDEEEEPLQVVRRKHSSIGDHYERTLLQQQLDQANEQEMGRRSVGKISVGREVQQQNLNDDDQHDGQGRTRSVGKMNVGRAYEEKLRLDQELDEGDFETKPHRLTFESDYERHLGAQQHQIHYEDERGGGGGRKSSFGGRPSVGGRPSEAHSIGSTGSDFFEKARKMHDTTPITMHTIPEQGGHHQGSKDTHQMSPRSLSRKVDGDIPENVLAQHVLGVDERTPRTISRESGSLADGATTPDSGLRPQVLAEDDRTPRTISRQSGSLADGATPDSSFRQQVLAEDDRTPRTISRQSGSLIDGATPESQLSKRFEDEAKVLSPGQTSSVSISSSIRTGATKVAGGLFNFVTGKKTEQHSESGGSDYGALAAFHKSREDRQQGRPDDATSASSYHMLPNGLRKMVLGNFTANDGEKNDFPQDRESDLHISKTATMSTDATSPSRTRDPATAVSPEHGDLIHQKLMSDSALLGDAEADQTIIDTDGNVSDIEARRLDPITAASLLMSPTLLTKRHKQAIRAIERRNWEQITHLVNANPWLAEMMEVTTEQFLLHKVALYGSSKFLWSDTNDAVDVIPAAPEKLNLDLLKLFPASVHKFDQDGNLPLHMAAASGNIEMMKLLCERFPSGASVRNNDGMLPLHLAVQACATPLTNAEGQIVYGANFCEPILTMFPGAVAVTDSEGDLPLHMAAAALEGEIGVDIVNMILDEADRQTNSEDGLRFVQKIKVKTEDDADDVTVLTDTPTEVTLEDDTIHCVMVKNDMGRNSLTKAIEAGSGWEVIETLARAPGGAQAALMKDANQNNALHLLLSEECGDPQAALSIMKMVPETTTQRNAEGMLPIEIACRVGMPREVILAIALVDLPVDLTDKQGVRVRAGYGGSWWFLTCESDDHHADLVEEIIGICTYEHLRELCFMKGGQSYTGAHVISRATPICGQHLRQALRFVGRFEFMGTAAVGGDPTRSLKVFDALDFGTQDDTSEQGTRVLLHCYSEEEIYERETSIFRQAELDTELIESYFDFNVHDLLPHSDKGIPQQWCVAIERPALTLEKVVEGMRRNDDYQHDEQMRIKYLSKASMVLRSVAKSLRHLHSHGIIHGDVCMEKCGKFGDKWKLMNIIGSRQVGSTFTATRIGQCAPPEAVHEMRSIVEGRSSRRPALMSQMKAHPSVDMWAFGKLMFEALTGEPLVSLDEKKDLVHDRGALETLLGWDEGCLRHAIDRLRNAGVSTTGADLVTHCLLPNPEERPVNMEEILTHTFWKDMRRKTVVSGRSLSEHS